MSLYLGMSSIELKYKFFNIFSFYLILLVWRKYSFCRNFHNLVIRGNILKPKTLFWEESLSLSHCLSLRMSFCQSIFGCKCVRRRATKPEVRFFYKIKQGDLLREILIIYLGFSYFLKFLISNGTKMDQKILIKLSWFIELKVPNEMTFAFLTKLPFQS